MKKGVPKIAKKIFSYVSCKYIYLHIIRANINFSLFQVGVFALGSEAFFEW